MHDKESVYLKIKRTGNLPTLPEALLKLLAACDDETIPIADIAGIISNDPGLGAKVLQLVNSAYYGLRNPVSSIEQAVVYLGANTIKNLAVTTSVHQLFNKKPKRTIQYPEPDVFWRQSLMCACICKHIAHRTESGNTDEAYLGGLLHNIGMLILALAFPGKYNTISSKTQKHNLLENLETDSLGITHGEAGGWVTRHWNLAPDIADAIELHHAKASSLEEAAPLVKIVHTASCLTEAYMLLEEDSTTCSELLELSPETSLNIIEEAEKEVDTMAANLGITISPRQKLGETEEEGLTSFLSTEEVDEDSFPTTTTDKAINGRLKEISLTSTFLEQLNQAENIEAMLQVFEESVNILFNLGHTLFFLQERNTNALHSTSSTKNSLHTTPSLRVLAEETSSLVATTFSQNKSLGFLTQDQENRHPIDKELLSIFETDVIVPLPLQVKKHAIGVVILGMPHYLHPLEDSSLELINILSQQLALSIQLEVEREQKAQDLYDKQMATIGLTAKKFAHEINNPLGIISNYLTAMKLKTKEKAIHDDLEIINEEINRIASMVKEMQVFDQAPFSQVEPVDLNKLVAQIVHLAESSLFADPSLQITFTPGNNLPQITSSRSAIKQILINIFKNSAEAMADGGKLVIRTLSFSRTSDYPKGNVKIIIADNGPGIPETVKTKLYKPFVTTKQNGHSGLGLSIINKAVTDIGGELSCSTVQEQGTTFIITLPTKGPVSSQDKI